MSHGKKNKKKKFNVKARKRELDNLFSRFIRNRDKICQRCGRPDNGHCSHIITRGNLAARWDRENAIQLCFRCHFYWWHKNPLEASEWIVGHLGKKRIDGLKKRSRRIYDSSKFPRDYGRLKAELEAELGKQARGLLG